MLDGLIAVRVESRTELLGDDGTKMICDVFLFGCFFDGSVMLIMSVIDDSETATSYRRLQRCLRLCATVCARSVVGEGEAGSKR